MPKAVNAAHAGNDPRAAGSASESSAAGSADAKSAAADLTARLAASRAAARALGAASTLAKDAVLRAVARALHAREDVILASNRADLAELDAQAAPGGARTGAAFRDRLALDPMRLRAMATSLEAVAELADPVGEDVERRRLPNGLRVRRVRAPLGVILMIFEARPNVATEAWSLGFKAGNAMILRGGKESQRTCAALYGIVAECLRTAGLPDACVWGVTDPDRALASALLKRDGEIDVVVPRGGEGLIRFVVEGTRIPVIKNDRGMCHAYVHADADPAMAVKVVANAKRSRPAACNSLETVLVHAAIAPSFLPALWDAVSAPAQDPPVRWRADPRALAALAGRAHVAAAAPADWDTEHLDFVLNARVVDSVDEALAHVARHGSRHSEAILTRDAELARRFQNEVDAAAVYWNASTRFTDGYELGLGGEIGISTQKLHARGPVGLRELTSARWIIDGEGQTR